MVTYCCFKFASSFLPKIWILWYTLVQELDESSACLNRHSRVFMGKRLYSLSHVNYEKTPDKFRGREPNKKTTKKREFIVFLQLITWCYDKQQACFVMTSKYTTVWFHWYALFMAVRCGLNKSCEQRYCILV